MKYMYLNNPTGKITVVPFMIVISIIKNQLVLK